MQYRIDGQDPAMKVRIRAFRSTTSCNECRKRKQKCNQGQPCNNCKRRSPEALCEYGPRNKQNKEIGGLPKSLFPMFSVDLDESSTVPAEGHTRNLSTTSSSSSSSNWSDLHQEIAPCESILDFRHLPRSIPPGGKSKAMRPCRARSLSTAGVEKRRKVRPTPTRALSLSSVPQQVTEEHIFLNLEYAHMQHMLKGSFEYGEGCDPDNPIVNDFIPWSLQSKLVRTTSRYCAAKTLAARGLVDESLVLQQNNIAIRELNYKLATEKVPGLETLASIGQFISIESYWDTGGLQAHLNGFRQAVKLRGGFSTHGIGALVAKTAKMDDAVIAMAFERRPVFTNLESEIEHQHNAQVPPINFNMPFQTNPFSFAASAKALNLHHTTAQILDDLRILIDDALALGANPLPRHMQSVRSLASWMYKGICDLPTTLEPQPVADEGLDASDAYSEETQYTQGWFLEPRVLGPDKLTFPPNAYANLDLVQLRSMCTPSRPADAMYAQSPELRSTEFAPGFPCNKHEVPSAEALYAVIRAAAPIYARAIACRQPFSTACSTGHAVAVLKALLSVPLHQLRGAIGLCVFAARAILPTVARSTDPRIVPHTVFVKGIVEIGYLQMAHEDWSIAAETAQRSLMLQDWLQEGVQRQSEISEESLDGADLGGDLFQGGFLVDMPALGQGATSDSRTMGVYTQHVNDVR